MRLDNDQTVGTAPDNIGQSGPDVALDGSVAGEENKSDNTDPAESESWWRQLLPW
jgi:hypothetical protein